MSEEDLQVPPVVPSRLIPSLCVLLNSPDEAKSLRRFHPCTILSDSIGKVEMSELHLNRCKAAETGNWSSPFGQST